jgi:hypothetical protein
MASSLCGGLDGSDYLGHFLYHFVHGFCGQLPNDNIEGFAAMMRLTI